MSGSGALASLSAIVAQWKDERENDEPEIEGGMYNVMSHPRRIPIAGSEWCPQHPRRSDARYLARSPAVLGSIDGLGDETRNV